MSNQLVSVSAGEVCSIDIAKQLGIFDAEYYFKPEYDSLKRFDGSAADRARTQRVCTINDRMNTAYPLCITSPNFQPGYVTKKEKGNLTDICQTASCPPGFEDKGDTCKKPTERRIISLGERNDERWEDWFTIPNYDLGNKFATHENKNYKPCKSGFVPNYAKDPVDGERVDWTSKDQPDRCVEKDLYFAGKYADTSDYCPTAMVKRYGFSRENLINSFKKANNKEDITQEEEKYLEGIYTTILEGLPKTETINLENEKLAYACNKEVDEKRLQETYDVCEQLSRNLEGFKGKFSNEPSSIVDMRTTFTKYACHNTFCPSQNTMNKAAAIDKDPICFNDVSEQMVRESLIKYKAKLAEENKPLPAVTSDPEKEKIKGAVIVIASLFGIMIICMVVYVVWQLISGKWVRIRELYLKKAWNLVLSWLYELPVLTKDEIKIEELQSDKIDLAKKNVRDVKKKEKAAALEDTIKYLSHY